MNYPQSGFTLKDIKPVSCLETKTHVSFFVTSEIIIVVLGWAESGFLIKKKKVLINPTAAHAEIKRIIITYFSWAFIC